MTDPASICTPADILMDLHGRMIRIETKLDSHAENHSALKATASALEARVGSLETAYRVLAAVGAVLLFVATFLQDAILRVVGL